MDISVTLFHYRNGSFSLYIYIHCSCIYDIEHIGVNLLSPNLSPSLFEPLLTVLLWWYFNSFYNPQVKFDQFWSIHRSIHRWFDLLTHVPSESCLFCFLVVGSQQKTSVINTASFELIIINIDFNFKCISKLYLNISAARYKKKFIIKVFTASLNCIHCCSYCIILMLTKTKGGDVLINCQRQLSYCKSGMFYCMKYFQYLSIMLQYSPFNTWYVICIWINVLLS